MTAIKFEAVPEFPKELNSAIKKYKHLEEDFERFKKALEIHQPQEMRGTLKISGLGINVKIPIYKVKHFRSQDFKGKGSKSGFRIIYAHMNEEHKMIFIEFYHKNNKTNHDVKRIKKYFEECYLIIIIILAIQAVPKILILQIIFLSFKFKRLIELISGEFSTFGTACQKDI